MKNGICSDQRFRIGIQVLFIYTWLSNSVGTDSFLTVYLLCGVVGVVCLWDNVHARWEISRGAQVCAWALAALFAVATVLANYPLYEPAWALISMFDACCSLIGGTFLAYNILICAIRRLPLTGSGERKHPVLAFFLFAGSIAAVFLLYLYTTGYPVYLAHDSLVSLKQIRLGVYRNNHPYWYTRFIGLCMDLGYLFSADINVAAAAYSTIQCVLMGLCFGYCLVTLYQARIPGWCIGIVFAMSAFLPYNLTYSITMWKDSLFGACSLAVMTALYRYLKGIGTCRWLNLAVFFVSGLAFCLLRNNGLPMFVLWCVCLMLCLGRKHWKLLLICLLVLCLGWFLTGPALELMNVESMKMVEVLAVPFQQIARVIALDLPIGEADSAFLKEIFWFDLVKELYTPYIVDPIKFEAMRPEGEAFLKENMGEFLRTWVRIGLQHPVEYVKAWVEETKGYWNGGYYYWIYIRGTYPASSGIGGFYPDNLGKDLFDALFRYTEKPTILEPLYSIGLQVWILIGSCFVCAVQKRKEFLVSVPLVALAVGLWFVTPVYAEFRYAYPMFLACPLILLTTVFSGNADGRKQVAK